MAVNQTKALQAEHYLNIYSAPTAGAGSVTVNLRNAGAETSVVSLALVPKESLSVFESTITNRGQFSATPMISLTGASSALEPTITVSFRLKSISAIANAGTDYQVGDVLTVEGGAPTTQAEILVTGVDGAGGITTATIQNKGENYAAILTNPITVTGGNGADASFSFFWELDAFVMTGEGYDDVPTVTYGVGEDAATIDLAMTYTPSAHQIIDAVSNFKPEAVLERTGLVVKAGWMLIAKGNDCAAAVWGFEQV